MISFRPTSVTTNRTIKDLTRTGFYFKQGLRRALFDIGLHGALEANRKINNDGRTGKLYLVNDTPHQASAEGQAPANRSGKLKKSISYRVQTFVEVEVGSNLDYARYLEYGTRRMKKRPFLENTARQQAVFAWNTISEFTDNAVKRRR